MKLHRVFSRKINRIVERRLIFETKNRRLTTFEVVLTFQLG